MSEADRQKWDARYAAGAYAEREYPSEWLAAQIDRLPQGPALDVACGRGRNALFLAAHGFQVDAVDISPVGLQLASAEGHRRNLVVNWLCEDLQQPDFRPPRDDYQLIIMFRFVALDLLRRLPGSLAPGGMLMVEQHLRWPAAPVSATNAGRFAGPRSDRFRVAPGELIDALEGVDVLISEEGVADEPDGQQAALARLLVRRRR